MFTRLHCFTRLASCNASFEFLLLIANKKFPAHRSKPPTCHMQIVAWTCRLAHVPEHGPPRLPILWCPGHDNPACRDSFALLLHIPLIFPSPFSPTTPVASPVAPYNAAIALFSGPFI